MTNYRVQFTLRVLALSALCTPSSVGSQTRFTLKDRTVDTYVGGGIGGGVDTYAQTLAPYLGRDLPGEPTVVVINMGGSGRATSDHFQWQDRSSTTRDAT